MNESLWGMILFIMPGDMKKVRKFIEWTRFLNWYHDVD